MIASQYAIDLKDVRVLRSGRWILDSVTAQIPAGACAAVLGPNGCGKSTMLRVVSGYLWPTRGEVEVLGQRFGETDLAELRKSIRLVQSGGVAEPAVETTALDVVLTGFFGTAGLYEHATDAQQESAKTELKRVGLSKVFDHPFGTLSSGERMRCMIARALVVRPRLLLLDEPTSGLDLAGREQVLSAIAQLHDEDQELTIVLTTHHLEELPLTTSHVVLLADGKPRASGPPDRVLTNDALSAAYGCPVNVTRIDGRFFATAKPVDRI